MARKPVVKEVGPGVDDDVETSIEVDYNFCNDEGHRIAVIDEHENVFIIDDDTAQILFENPSFYARIYNPFAKDSVATNTLQFADKNKQPTGIVVGTHYDRVEQ